MNYLAHARDHLDQPYAVAGTSLPDWLRVLGRRHRIDADALKRDVQGDSDSPEDRLRHGVVRHYVDDKWFHVAPAFAHVTGVITKRIRRAYPDPVGTPRPRHIRASFFAHVVMELLLDGWLIEQDPTSVDRYYKALDAVDEVRIERYASAVLGYTPERLTELIRGFRRYPFLRTYVDDHEVCRRLDQVARRVRLPALPEGFEDVVTWARDVVREHAEVLLTEPPA
ncbi:MAG: hypothetical protein QNJ98_02370 [Planctomycetota bacterium]|nr:hypothetical protein [Planctomycetota bacterium]